jgi:malonyl-CoA O-methyltransferase
VQREMARRLVACIPQEEPFPSDLLEIACGTGHLTRELALRFPGVPLLATDASNGMLERVRDKVILGHLPASLRTERLDVLEGLSQVRAGMLASGALVQWLPDLVGHFRDAAQALPSGGLYVLSGFCRTNFPELNAILEAPPFSYREFPGHFLADACRDAEVSGFDVVVSRQEEWVVEYPSAREFLAMLKATGAVRSPEKGMDRRRAAALLTGLDDGEGTAKATWKPWFLVLRRR